MLLVAIADKVHLKRSYRAEFKLTLSELFVERSKKTPLLKSASLSTRRFAAYVYFFEVAWRSNLDNHSRDRARACKTHGFHCRPLEPGKYATEIRGPRHVQLDFPVHKPRQTELTKDSRSKWRLWPLRPAVSCTGDGADWPKVVAVGAQQPISDFFGFIQIRDTLSTNGEHHRVAEVKRFPAIPKSMRSVNGDQNGANLKKWSVLLVCTIGPKKKLAQKFFRLTSDVRWRGVGKTRNRLLENPMLRWGQKDHFSMIAVTDNVTNDPSSLPTKSQPYLIFTTLCPSGDKIINVDVFTKDDISLPYLNYTWTLTFSFFLSNEK